MALLVLRSLELSGQATAQLAVVMLIIANFVNHPHFAHSYQLFYGTWGELRRDGLPPPLRRHWFLAGCVAPVALAILLAMGSWLWFQGQGLLLALMINLMGALVGWHYVKQGFGMAMMDAALKKQFWRADARKALLVNAYACWAAAWVIANGSNFGRAYWGVAGIKYSVPPLLVVGACAIAAITTAWAGLACYWSIQVWKQTGLGWRQWPLAGTVAYVVTLYIWTVFVTLDAAFVLVVPFFHSLQYMAVVWRYKINEQSSNAVIVDRRQLVKFAMGGLVLGALGFWLLPGLLDYWRTGSVPRYGEGVALAIACMWLFINVHHYFIDSVLWRQGNPKVSQYLFNAA